MAKLTRKVWIGIGAVTIASAPLVASAQDRSHSGHQPANSQEPGVAGATATEGGEAYLSDGGPKDTRIRFYRDIALMRGHLLVGDQLIAKGLWMTLCRIFCIRARSSTGTSKSTSPCTRSRPSRAICRRWLRPSRPSVRRLTTSVSRSWISG